jgi:thioester reductase-like protein
MRVEALAEDLAKVEASLELKETRWLELAERADIG